MTTNSNGWGHLIVTLAVLAFCAVLLIQHVVDSTAILTLLGPVIAFWFLAGSSKFSTPATTIVQPATAPPQSGVTLP